MNERKIPFSFASLSLEASDYSVAAKDKLMQLSFANGKIRTVVVGRAASQICISGKLPANESYRFIDTLEPLIDGTGRTLTLDSSVYTKVILDSCIVKPAKSSGFAQFELVFHY